MFGAANNRYVHHAIYYPRLPYHMRHLLSSPSPPASPWQDLISEEEATIADEEVFLDTTVTPVVETSEEARTPKEAGGSTKPVARLSKGRSPFLESFFNGLHLRVLEDSVETTNQDREGEQSPKSPSQLAHRPLGRSTSVQAVNSPEPPVEPFAQENRLLRLYTQKQNVSF